MNILNEARFSFPSRSVNERFARIAVSGFFAQMDPAVDELTDIKTAVSEAVTNCIVHAYRDTIGKVSLTLRVLEGGIAYIRIRDNGCGIPDIRQAMEPLFTTAPEEDRAGLGFAVMQSFMDRVRVYSTPGRGTTVVMTKALLSRAPEARERVLQEQDG